MKKNFSSKKNLLKGKAYSPKHLCCPNPECEAMFIIPDTVTITRKDLARALVKAQENDGSTTWTSSMILERELFGDKD